MKRFYIRYINDAMNAQVNDKKRVGKRFHF